MKLPKIQYKFLDPKTGYPLRIVGDAGITSSGSFGGRFIPLVILDTSERPDVEEFIRVHHAITTLGDVIAQWGQIENKETTVILWLKFIRPVEISFAIEFNVVGQAILVDQALNGKGLYIQAGREGDRLKHDLNRPKIIMEIIDTGYGQYWERTFLKQHEKNFRTKGLSRSESRRAAAALLQELRGVFSFRMRDPNIQRT